LSIYFSYKVYLTIENINLKTESRYTKLSHDNTMA
jgi:hypothetical protein